VSQTVRLATEIDITPDDTMVETDVFPFGGERIYEVPRMCMIPLAMR